MFDVSEPAPEFSLPATDGSTLSLAAQRPAPVVLFFYPRDNTPGCTKEAIEFTDALPAFTTAGARVFGISKDTLTSHDKFITKKNLGMVLLTDADSDVCERYGVWKEKKMYGKIFMGIERTTVLIDCAGNVARIWRKVKVDGHVTEVLDAVNAL